MQLVCGSYQIGSNGDIGLLYAMQDTQIATEHLVSTGGATWHS